MFFTGINFDSFWDNSGYSIKFIKPRPTDEVIAAFEKEFGYKLPASYVYLMQNRNTGFPVNTKHAASEPTSWADDHIEITSILGIFEGRNKGDYEDWGYPDIGIPICDCPSAGHDMVFLDYRECGPLGEPKVVHVDQEWDYKITFLAENFETFIEGLY